MAWKLFWCFVAFSWSQGPKRFEFLERLKTKCRRPDPRAGFRRSYFFLVVFFAVDFFAGALRAVVFFAVDFFAAVLRAVVFFAAAGATVCPLASLGTGLC